ncbi:MAG TPA: carboxypeptidase-like regulatory domain-containing protein, partial [Clostridiaceae bacterium]|nr:carboxypeptidase-like regulatory domain-containing protein [Clostridiaceae bacterium]
MKKILYLLICLFVYHNISAQNYTVSGYITDEKSGETQINASIYDFNSRKGTVSNVYGFYSLTLPAGEVSLQYSYVGYHTQSFDFNLNKDTVIHIRFKEST